MTVLKNLWAAWGQFWTARAEGAQPNRDMRAYRIVARVLNIQS